LTLIIPDFACGFCAVRGFFYLAIAQIQYALKVPKSSLCRRASVWDILKS
jgi:hypothetical protein